MSCAYFSSAFGAENLSIVYSFSAVQSIGFSFFCFSTLRNEFFFLLSKPLLCYSTSLTREDILRVARPREARVSAQGSETEYSRSQLGNGGWSTVHAASLPLLLLMLENASEDHLFLHVSFLYGTHFSTVHESYEAREEHQAYLRYSMRHQTFGGFPLLRKRYVAVAKTF